MFTVKDLQDRLNADHATAYALCKSLHSLGIFKNAGVRPNKTGRGRGATLYKFNEGFGAELEAMIMAALGRDYEANIEPEPEPEYDPSEMDYDPDEDRTP